MMPKQADILTTSQVSRTIGMSVRTVCRLIDSGMLRGWAIPGSKHRRVARADLESFMADHGIPISEAKSK